MSYDSIERSFVRSMYPKLKGLTNGSITVVTQALNPKPVSLLEEKIVTEVPHHQPDATAIYQDVFKTRPHLPSQN
jgi:hypothetical protein